ncbi:MAG: RNA 2',3'-cyclic phosphodiesterase [Candidatus Altarchaeaceae archaeon]
MRTFISINCPLDMKFDELKECGNLNIVKKENFHITLKFLGEIDKKTVTEISNKLKFLENYKEFKISLYGIGTFPNENYVRVLWIGVDEGKDKIIEIQKEIDKVLEYKFQKEKDFVPHLTIARIKSISNKEKFKNFIEKYRNFKFLEFQCKEISLMKSELKKEGAEYTEIEKFKLKS